MRTGRIGFEVQYLLLVNPRYLRFDPEQKKLGIQLDPGAVTHPLPDGWTWHADPMAASEAGPPSEALVVDDIRERFGDSRGYRTTLVYQDKKANANLTR